VYLATVNNEGKLTAAPANNKCSCGTGGSTSREQSEHKRDFKECGLSFLKITSAFELLELRPYLVAFLPLCLTLYWCF